MIRRDYAVVIPSGFPDLLVPCLQSVKKYEQPRQIVVVWSGKEDAPDVAEYGADVSHLGSPFVFAKAANRGMEIAKDKDIVLMNDDVTLQMETFHKLKQEAYTDDKIGIIAPVVDGGVGNPLQSAHRFSMWPGSMTDKGRAKVIEIKKKLPVCFVCVYIRRDAINEIGPMDEQFDKYGMDDVDYCLRMREAGWKTLITRERFVRHGKGGRDNIHGKNWSLSYSRIFPGGTDHVDNMIKFRRKWGISHC